MNGFESTSLGPLNLLLLNAFGRITLLLLLAWGITGCFRRLGAAQQHFLWLCALLGIVYVTGASLVAATCSAMGLKSTFAALPVRVWQSPELKRVVTTPASALPSSAPASAPLPSASTVVRHPLEFPVNGFKTVLVTLLWLLGSLFNLLRLVRHYRAVWLLQRRSIPLEGTEIHALLAQVVARLEGARSPVLLQAENGLSPLTWGWRRTFLLLPASVKTWSQERIEAVLLHEVAHLQRNDWLTQRLADAVCVLFWFHPLIWLSASRMRACAERACDDVALAHGIAPGHYAQHLLDIAQTLRKRLAAPELALPLVRMSLLEKRLCSVLDGTVSRRAFSQKGQCSLLIGGAFCLMPFALALPVTTQNVHYVDANVITAVHDKAVLPGDVTVELLGIAATDAGAKAPAQWWLPNGTFTLAPYDLTNAFRVLDSEKDHRFQRIFSVRISGVPEENPDAVRELRLNDANKPGQAETLGSYGEVYENKLRIKNGNRYTLTRSDYFGNVHLPEHATFRYGVALGEWHDLASADLTMKTTHVDVNNARVIFKKAINKGFIMKLPGGKQTTGLTIETQDNQGRVARRLVAITRQGKTVKIGSMFTGPEGAMTTYTCLVPPELALVDIREYHLQTRPYTWAEFPNVALNPRK